MKNKSKKMKRESLLKGALSAFSIEGEGLELRNQNNILVSWHNVGVYFKRGMNQTSKSKGLLERFKESELETY